MTIRHGHPAPSRLVLGTALALAVAAASAGAQDLSRYRAYALDSPLADVLATSGVRASEVETLHERPALIQQVEWRAPHLGSTAVDVDPVRAILFAFHDGRLYQMTVTYHRERTAGLTAADLIGPVAAVYGTPMVSTAKSRGDQRGTLPDMVTLARWETPAASVTLLRDAYTPDIRLIVRATARGAMAATAIRQSLALDIDEGPLREQQARDAALAETAAAKSRNKPAFKP